MTGNEARQLFLDYFHKRGHKIVRSGSLVPRDDPTLLFTNAGMVQFKRAFLGEEKRDYNRATTSQKCVRAGGKHNDLENVGYTARHHTFFEMLGNFSFGDYFKKDAVIFAWDLLTNGYGLPGDKLWASIYLDDDEAFDLWHDEIGLPGERIVRLGKADNFWAMGDTGPCGPCSELHLDRGEAHGCGRPECAVGCDCDRYLEIWNLVFMQFNQDASGGMTPLPKPSIDTGLGLERIASVMQNVNTNFDTDLILPIIRKTEELSEKSYGTSRESDVAMKVIADHSRAAAFLIGDGVLPANEGRGYVLRRIMRRAIRYGRNIGLVRPFLHQTAETVFDVMRPAYPELKEASAFIVNVIQNEERRFSETLDKGMSILTDTLGELRAKGQKTIPGDLIFKLYDTYGFPVDIVRDTVREEDFTLDMNGYDTRMASQRERSRTRVSFDGAGEAFRALAAGGFKSTFVGYDLLFCESKIVVLAQNGTAVSHVDEGEEVEIVTETTPFYGESGGQAGDTGTMTSETGTVDIADTLKDPAGLTIHRGNVATGNIKTGQIVQLQVNEEKRAATACNHTATHILHHALRRVLGDHVKQAGSLVAPDRFRFDFTHFSQVTADDLFAVERIANRRIQQNVSVDILETTMEKAVETGATALFEEKYGDRVRVISLGDFSKELCGGTHTSRTGDIGLLKIDSEASVAAGVRRIEAVTGMAAINKVQVETGLLKNAALRVKVKPDGLPDRIQTLLDRQRKAEKELEQMKRRLTADSAGEAKDEIRRIGPYNAVIKKVEVADPGDLRDLADRFSDRIKSGVVVLGAVSGSKALLIVKVSKDLTDRLHAGNIIKAAAARVGGGGGGRPDMAQAGGSNPQALDKALDAARGMIAEG